MKDIAPLVDDYDDVAYGMSVWYYMVQDVSLEDICAFTWTPDPAKYPSSECRKQYKSLLLYTLLDAYKCFSSYMFVPEINKNGNIHIHGWFRIKDKIRFYKWFLPRCKQYGFVLIKSKVDCNWNYYCLKEVDVTKYVIGEDLPVILTHDNYKDYIEKKKMKVSLLKERGLRMQRVIKQTKRFRQNYWNTVFLQSKNPKN